MYCTVLYSIEVSSASSCSLSRGSSPIWLWVQNVVPDGKKSQRAVVRTPHTHAHKRLQIWDFCDFFLGIFGEMGGGGRGEFRLPHLFGRLSGLADGR